MKRASATILFAALLWSTSGLFIKLLEWPAMAIWVFRSLITIPIYLLYLGRGGLQGKIRGVELIIAVGFLCAQLFFIIGNKIAPAANVIFLAYTQPVWIIPGAWYFLRERPQRADWNALLIIVIGMVLFFGGDLDRNVQLGNLFGILAGMSVSTMTLGIRKLQERDAVRGVLIGSVVASLVGLPFVGELSYTPTNIGIILWLGIFQIAVPFILFSRAAKHVPALEATLLATLEPIANPIWVFLVLGEIPRCGSSRRSTCCSGSVVSCYCRFQC